MIDARRGRGIETRSELDAKGSTIGATGGMSSPNTDTDVWGLCLP